MQAFEFCRDDVAPRFSDWAFAARGLSAQQKQALFGALCFAYRVADIPHRASEAQIAQAQIAWWRNQVQLMMGEDPAPVSNAASSKNRQENYIDVGSVSNAIAADSEFSTHPSLQCLAALLKRKPELVTRLQSLVEHAEHDVHFTGYQTQDEWIKDWSLRTDATWALLLATVELEMNANWRAIGLFAEWIMLLKQWPRFAKDGVIYLPTDLLAKAGLSAEALTAEPESPAFATLLAEQSLRLTQNARDALTSLTPIERNQSVVFRRWLHLQLAWLNATSKQRFPLYRYRIELGALQKRWITSTSAWREF